MINVGALTMQYRRLFDAGTVRYWSVTGDRQDESRHKDRFLTVFGLKVKGGKQYSKRRSEDEVRLSDSVVAEIFCLYWLCLAGSVAVLIGVALWKEKGQIKELLWGKFRNLHCRVVHVCKPSRCRTVGHPYLGQ